MIIVAVKGTGIHLKQSTNSRLTPTNHKIIFAKTRAMIVLMRFMSSHLGSLA